MTDGELIQSIFDSEVRSGRIERELKKLEGKEYIDAILKLTGFVLPKLNSVDLTQSNTGVKQIIVVRASVKGEMRQNLFAHIRAFMLVPETSLRINARLQAF